MRSLVVYDSQFGNTEHVAQVIAKVLGDYGPARAAHIHETSLTQLRDIDLLVVGSPTQGGHATADIRDFIKRLPPDALRRPKIACFDTRMRAPRWLGRFAAPQLARQFRHLDIALVAPPEGFIVKERAGPLADGEAERAAEWGRAIARDIAPQGARPQP